MADGEATQKGQALLSELEAELTPEPGEQADTSNLEDFLGGRSANASASEPKSQLPSRSEDPAAWKYAAVASKARTTPEKYFFRRVSMGMRGEGGRLAPEVWR